MTEFKRTETTGRLKYEGYCNHCGQQRYHRFEGGSVFETNYRCMTCNNINTEKNNVSLRYSNVIGND